MKRSGRRRNARHPQALAGAVLGLAAVTGLGIGAWSTRGGTAPSTPAAQYTEVATNCRAIDGDTLHCDGGRIRLLGIDAPELPGHCAIGRDCAPGDPDASTQSLSAGMGDGRAVKIEPVGTDRYGRTLALVMGRGGDLSCWQLAHGQAIYKPGWDNDARVRGVCPEYAH